MKSPIILIIVGLAAWTLAGIVSGRVTGVEVSPIAACVFAVLGAYLGLTLSHSGK